METEQAMLRLIEGKLGLLCYLQTERISEEGKSSGIKRGTAKREKRQEDVTIRDRNAPNDRASRFVERTRTNLRGESDTPPSTPRASLLLSVTGRCGQRKISKGTVG